MFLSSHFSFFGFWSLLATKLWKYYIIFVYILQGKMGKMEKKQKKIPQLKWPQYQKPKEKILDEQNYTEAIWTFTFHKKSGFRKVILKSNFKPAYKPVSWTLWSENSDLLSSFSFYFFAGVVKSTAFCTLLLLHYLTCYV